jgi:hypothetical protein
LVELSQVKLNSPQYASVQGDIERQLPAEDAGFSPNSDASKHLAMRKGVNMMHQTATRRKNFIPMIFAALLLLTSTCAPATAQVSVTTWHNDVARTGQNLNETILTPANVKPAQFGKLYSRAVDGYVFAEPLYLPGVTIGGQLHNVLYVATEHDSVYAFDADSNTGANASPLWFASLLTQAYGAAAGATTVSSSVVGTDIWPEIGITGTPVIDPSTGTLYVVSKTAENGAYVQRLHALDVTTGAEKFGGPVQITASVSGTGVGSSGGTLAFDPLWENQRPGLLLLNGIIYIAWASHGDTLPFHGWVIAYNASTLSQTGAYCATRNGFGAGIWMSGAGLAAEIIDPVNYPYGRIFVPTGNGDYHASVPYTSLMDYGDSIVNLDLSNGVPTIKDEFTPYNQLNMEAGDLDLAAGGALILPTQTTGSYPNLLVVAGKSGTLYLLDRENLGGYTASGDQVVQEITNAVGVPGVWSSPAYWNGNIYYWGVNDKLKSFSLADGQLTGPTGVSSETLAFPGATPSISANGTTQGIVWAINSDGYGGQASATLFAHDALNTATTFYSSATNVSRDDPGPAVKFAVPTIVNGKVYVGAEYLVSVYGLITGMQPAATPQLSPVGGTFYGGTQTVTITDATPGASIYYTTNGTRPTVASNLFTAPIVLTTTTKFAAIAVAPGYLQSNEVTATYNDSNQINPPAFSIKGGTYTQAETVTISDAQSTASIYYTTDGSTPVPNAGTTMLYGGPITVASTTALSAIATGTGFNNSPVVSETITLMATSPTFSEPGHSYTTTQTVTLSDTTLNAGIYYTTDGTTPVPNAGTTVLYNGPITISATTTIKAIASLAGWTNSSMAYETITLTATAPTFSEHGSTYTSPQTVSLSDTTPNAGIYYTTDGTTPVPNAGTTVPYNGPITISATTTIKAIASLAGWSNSSTAYETITLAVTAPTFSEHGSTYTSPQTVSLSDTTPNAGIYYTTDGTTPVPNAGTTALYNEPITISATTTIKAIASLAGWSNSSTAYETITLAVTAPTFSEHGSTYASPQTVSLSDTTPNASIYYTTDGTTPVPNAGTTVPYNGPITVGSTTTIKAVASLAGWSNSSTAYETITLQAAEPTFSEHGGSYTSVQTVTLSDTTPNASIYYTTDGTTPVPNAGTTVLYNGPITIGATTTIKAIASLTGWNNSIAVAETITLVATVPTFSEPGGTYTSAQTVSLSDTTPNASIYYTTDGTTPVPNAGTTVLYNGAITISATTTIKAMASAPGWSNSGVTTAKYTIP